MDSVPASLAVDGSAEASSPEVEAFCTAEVATENAVASGDPELIGPAVEAVRPPLRTTKSGRSSRLSPPRSKPADPSSMEAYAELIDYMRANCGFAQLDLVASEYVFSGFPAELPAGPIIVSFENIGTEVHEVTFIRFNEDVTLTPDELFALPAEQQEAMATFEGVALCYPGDDRSRCRPHTGSLRRSVHPCRRTPTPRSWPRWRLPGPPNRRTPTSGRRTTRSA